MRQKLCRRLEQLEKVNAAASLTSIRESADSAIEDLRAILRANDFQQEPNESLAETLGRFMGINLRELKAQLAEMANGHSRSVQQGGY